MGDIQSFPEYFIFRIPSHFDAKSALKVFLQCTNNVWVIGFMKTVPGSCSWNNRSSATRLNSFSVTSGRWRYPIIN